MVEGAYPEPQIENLLDREFFGGKQNAQEWEGGGLWRPCDFMRGRRERRENFSLCAYRK